MILTALRGFAQRGTSIISALTLGLGLCLILSSSVSLAQKPSNKITRLKTLRQHDGKTVTKISVKGLKRIEVDAVKGQLVTKVGKPLRRKNLARDIRAIYGMGFFEEVQINAKSAGAKKVSLTYRIRERPVISEIIFEGNKQVDTGDLLGVIKAKEWAILDINQLREDVDRILKHYEDRGFYLAKVRYELKADKKKKDEIKVTFKIDDFEKVMIKKITFLNNKIFSDSQLKSVFQGTQEGGFWSFLSGSGNFKEAAFKQDLTLLTLWYLDHGYIKFSYENPIVTVSDDKKWLYISVYVNEGKKYDIGSIDFGGDLLFKKSELREELKLLEDQEFKISLRNLDIQHLTEMYQDKGYAFVNVIPRMNINDKERKVDITYTFEKGNLVHFGEINVVGNTKTHDKVIRRELRIHEGELFSGSRLRQSRERVERLGYFAPGEVIFNTLTRPGRDDIVDLEIKVKERSTGTITLGAGYGSVQKFFLTTQISEINLFGRGQQLSFSASYSADSKTRSFNLGFTDPYSFDTKWSLGFDLFFVSFQIPNRYTMRKLGFDIRGGYPISDEINAYITYKNEGLRVVDKVDANIPTADDEGTLSSIVWSLIRDLRNNRFEPTSGNYQSIALETAGLGGDKKFVKLNLNNRFYYRLVGDLVFRTSQEFGQIWSIGGSPIPTSERFLLGGPNNLKGFRILSVGPQQSITLSNGNTATIPFGGTTQMFALFEFEYPLIREAGLKWVMFYDIGNSFASFPGTDGVPFKLRHDVGFGFRWFSPIGPLRFEWGFPLDPEAGESTSEFQFFIGPPF